MTPKEKKQAYDKTYYAANREKILARDRERHAANPEIALAKNKAYYAANREKELARNKAYCAANPEKTSARHKAHNKRYYAANHAERLAYNKAYRNANHPKISAQKKVYCAANREKISGYLRQRHATDPEFQLVGNLRRRIYKAIKRGSKAARSRELFGCAVPELRAHLEKQFRQGMTWENYGPVWHIDHIKPCAKFDLADPAQQRECFHYTNLQPLFAEENLRKGARV